MATALDIETLDAMIAESPANAWLGLRAQAIGDQQLVLHLPWREALRGDARHADDGALMFALNAACGYLIVALTGRGGAIADLRCDRLAPAPAGRDLVIIASLLKLGRTLSCTQARMQTGDGQVLMLSRCNYFMATA